MCPWIQWGFRPLLEVPHPWLLDSYGVNITPKLPTLRAILPSPCLPGAPSERPSGRWGCPRKPRSRKGSSSLTQAAFARNLHDERHRRRCLNFVFFKVQLTFETLGAAAGHRRMKSTCKNMPNTAKCQHGTFNNIRNPQKRSKESSS